MAVAVAEEEVVVAEEEEAVEAVALTWCAAAFYIARGFCACAAVAAKRTCAVHVKRLKFVKCNIFEG